MTPIEPAAVSQPITRGADSHHSRGRGVVRSCRTSRRSDRCRCPRCADIFRPIAAGQTVRVGPFTVDTNHLVESLAGTLEVNVVAAQPSSRSPARRRSL